MVNPGAVNSPSMWGIAAAYHAMCCPKVTSKSKSVVQPRGECNSLPCNGLGRATILESALAIYVEGEWVVYRKGGHHQVMVKCGKKHGWTSFTSIRLSSSSTTSPHVATFSCTNAQIWQPHWVLLLFTQWIFPF